MLEFMKDGKPVRCGHIYKGKVGQVIVVTNVGFGDPKDPETLAKYQFAAYPQPSFFVVQQMSSADVYTHDHVVVDSTGRS